jgi:HSP20 family protein
MSEKNIILVTPAVGIDLDKKNYYLEVELPGVKKEDVSLEISEKTFCIEGKREDVTLYGCYYLANPVDNDHVTAKFEDGMLEVTIPLSHSLERKSVSIA